MRLATQLAGAAAAVALAGAPAFAADGILISQKVTNSGNTTNNQVQIEKNRMRAETIGQNGRKQVVIFDGTAQVLRILDDEAKTYQELTKADVDRLAAQMSGAMAQMQQQMQNMPPEQRARIEAMMQGRGMGAAAATPTEYKKVGTDKVGKWTCDKYEGTQNGQKTSEVCTVAPSAVGFTPADFEVTRQLAEFFSKIVPQASERLFKLGSNEPNGYSGIPVRTVTFSNGQPQMTAEVTDATRANIPDSVFAVPSGYEKRDFMAGRGGRGRGRGQQQ